MPKILIATGGTGGHLFPAQQMAKELVDCTLLFAGHKLHESPFFDRSFPYVEIASSNKQPLQILKGIWQSIKMILREKPDVVVGFGSFHSFPILFAAALLRKKIVLFEANCSFGKVNQWFSFFAKKVAMQFPVLQKEKIVQVPLLPWGATRKMATREEAARYYNLDPKLFTILVFGGSQGAKFINQIFPESAKLLGFPFQVIHLTGKEEEIHYSVPSAVKVFETQMEMAYALADMAVCRCGAGTTAELIRANLPAVLIPYPFAYDHQKENARYLKNGVKILLQKETTAEKLAAEILQLRQNLQIHKEALAQVMPKEAAHLSKIVRSVGSEQ